MQFVYFSTTFQINSGHSILTLRDSACFLGYGARKPHDRAPVKLRGCSEPLSSKLGEPSQRPYILQSGAILSLQAKTKVEEKVQTIRSEHPILVRMMSISNVDGIGCNICEMVSYLYPLFYANMDAVRVP